MVGKTGGELVARRREERWWGMRKVIQGRRLVYFVIPVRSAGQAHPNANGAGGTTLKLAHIQ